MRRGSVKEKEDTAVSQSCKTGRSHIRHTVDAAVVSQRTSNILAKADMTDRAEGQLKMSVLCANDVNGKESSSPDAGAKANELMKRWFGQGGSRTPHFMSLV